MDKMPPQSTNKNSTNISYTFHKVKHSSKYIKNKIRKANPPIFSFNSTSKFIYEPTHSTSLINDISDKNELKPTNDQLNLLETIYCGINSRNLDQNTIQVKPFFSLIIDNLKENKKRIDDKASLIRDIIKKNSKKGSISIRKITENYNTICNDKNLPKITKSTTHRIVKKILRYSFRKTKLKNYKLIENKSIIYSFFFLKIFLRAITLKFQPIYLDESGFFTSNNNLYMWRGEKDEIFTKIEDRKRTNLLMAVGANKIYCYDITRKNTDQSVFKHFMENLVKNMSAEEKENHVIILDNLSAHLTPELFQFYRDNGLKILFNVPYNSSWNMIELVFRWIKNITYKNIYQNISSLEKDLLQIIKSGKIEESLPSLYKETLLKYHDFIIKNNNINLNLLDI